MAGTTSGGNAFLHADGVSVRPGQRRRHTTREPGATSREACSDTSHNTGSTTASSNTTPPSVGAATRNRTSQNDSGSRTASVSRDHQHHATGHSNPDPCTKGGNFERRSNNQRHQCCRHPWRHSSVQATGVTVQADNQRCGKAIAEDAGEAGAVLGAAAIGTTSPQIVANGDPGAKVKPLFITSVHLINRTSS